MGRQRGMMGWKAPPDPQKRTLDIWEAGRAAQAGRYKSALERFQERYETGMEYGEQALEEVGEIPGEFGQAAELYAPGGRYGEGARTRIREAQKTGTAAGMAQLARTGMSSGTLAEGVRARYAREAETAFKEVQDVQYGKYAEALQTLGAAKEARYGRTAQVQLSLAGMAIGAQEPTYAGSASQLDISAMGEAGAYARAKMGAQTQMATAKMQQETAMAGIGAQVQQQRYGLQFGAGEAEKQREFTSAEAEKQRYFSTSIGAQKLGLGAQKLETAKIAALNR